LRQLTADLPRAARIWICAIKRQKNSRHRT
jgi:hypothetical protein